MLRYILSEPLYLQIWIFWFAAVNTACVFFLRRVEARWVLAAWISNLLFMTTLFEVNGYNRLLGVSHVLFWTPLLIYLYRRRAFLAGSEMFDRWARIVFVTNLISLMVDYVDVLRYVAGDRA